MDNPNKIFLGNVKLCCLILINKLISGYETITHQFIHSIKMYMKAIHVPKPAFLEHILYTSWSHLLLV